MVSENKPTRDSQVIIMHGFSNEQIGRIMQAVKGLFPAPRDLIFAKTTENSLRMQLDELITDISQDHEYLKRNPPQR